MIELQAASLVYQDHGKEVFAVRQVSLTVQEGEFVGILGPSGSGKSSLLYLLSGLKDPTHGGVLVDGRDLQGMGEAERAQMRLKEFGFLFQLPYLIGYLTALENVLVATPDRDCRKEAFELLGELGLADKAHRHPHELSGGERQRVCVARALVGGRRAVFADEPTASLDHKNGLQVVDRLNRCRGNGSLVMVTHDPSMLEKADRVVHISDGRVAETTYS